MYHTKGDSEWFSAPLPPEGNNLNIGIQDWWAAKFLSVLTQDRKKIILKTLTDNLGKTVINTQLLSSSFTFQVVTLQ